MNTQEFIEYVAKSIVSIPSEVMIERNMNAFDETYVIHVNEADMGVLIGKGGKNINSLRNLVSIKAQGNRIFVQIAEKEILA